MSKPKDCSGCGRNTTCLLIRAFHDIINKHFPNNQPFAPEDIAKICKAYISQSAMDTAKALHGEFTGKTTTTEPTNTGMIAP